MKKLLPLALILLLLTSCSSSVSQEEYDAAVSDKMAFESEASSYASEVESLTAELTALQNSIPEEPELIKPEYKEDTFFDITYKINKSFDAKDDKEIKTITLDDECIVTLQQSTDIAALDDAAIDLLVEEIEKGYADKFDSLDFSPNKTYTVVDDSAVKIDFVGKNGKGSFSGDYHITIFELLHDGDMYSIQYSAPADLYDLYYRDYLVLLDSIALPEVEEVEEVPEPVVKESSSSAASSSKPVVEAVAEPEPEPTPEPVPEPTPEPESQVPAEPVAEEEPQEDPRTVFWVPNGKSYHFSEDCATLKRSTDIRSGTLAQSRKSDPCNVCAGGQ